MLIRAGVSAFFLLASSAFSQKLSGDEREILWHQDQRLLSDSVLVRYLEHKDSRIRRRAAIAIGNIQDTTSVPSLLPLLNDGTASVRGATAFALGEIGSPLAEQELAERMRSETDPDVVARLLDALGKSGSSHVFDDVVAFGFPKRMIALKADQAFSIARFALRNIKSERGVWFCFDALEEQDPRIRWSALYALWRIGPHGAIDVELAKRKDVVMKLASDKSADVRMHLATLLSKTRSSDGLEVLLAIQKNEGRKGRGDWRVQVNLVRAFAALAGRNDDALGPLISYLGSTSDHVTISALAAITGLSKDAVRKYEDAKGLQKKLEQLARPTQKRSESVRGEALVTLARHFPAEFNYEGILTDKKSSIRLKSKVLEAVSSIATSDHLSMMMERLDDDSIRVSMAAWDFIKRLLAPQSFRSFRKDTAVTNELGIKLFRKAKISLLREDLAVTTLVANALGDSALFSFFIHDGVEVRAVEELMLAYGKLSAPNDVEAMQAILETLGKVGDDRVIPLLERAVLDHDRTVGLSASAALKRLTGNSYDDQVTKLSKPVYSDYDWKTLEAIGRNQKAVIKTRKGTITIQFLKQDAPFTVLSFYKLVRKRFFHRLNFHRVVPNFVVQGGDPRGDGWGGPNYAIRSEFSLVNFERGMVGVASAGKDTEGCQFFITHSPQPHLDGRYTIFARVVAGMDVVDRIQIGDDILSITLAAQ